MVLVANKTAQLYRFCKLFNIALENCTCMNPDIKEGFKSICKEDVTPRTVFESVDETLIAGIILTIASVIGILGNGLVLTIAWKNRNNYLVCQKLIATLAASDFLFGVLQLIFAIPKLWTDKWLYHPVGCKVMFAGAYLGGMLAIGFVVIISIERFVGVVKPMYNSYRLIAKLCVLNILIGVATVIPLMIYYEVDKYDICLEAWPKRSSAIIYHSYLLIATFILPISTVITLYGIIVVKLRKGLFDKSMVQSMDVKLYKKRIRETTRVIKIVLGLAVAFICLVGPTRVTQLLLNVKHYSNSTYRAISVVSLVMYSFHVAINPLLYSVIDVRWRTEFKRVFNSRIPRKMTYTNGGSNSPPISHRRMTRVDTPQTLDDSVPVTPSPTTKGFGRKMTRFDSPESPLVGNYSQPSTPI